MPLRTRHLAIVILIEIAGCGSSRPWAHATEAPSARAERTVAIVVTARGFEPARVDARVGETLTLVFTRQIQRTCVKRVVLSLDDEHTLERDLPMEVAVPVTLTLDRAGELGFSCPMGMHSGVIEVR